MNRQEFMNRLASELSRLPKDEIRAAMEYYTEYFEEAGPENEQQVIADLGNPSKIATQIKADYAVKQLDRNDGTAGRKSLTAVWWVILGIFAAPIALPVAIAIGCVVFAIFISIVAIAFSLLVAFGAFCVGGVAMIILGIAGLASSFAGGLLLIGIGLLTTGLMAILCVGVFIGARALIRAIALQIRKSSEVRKVKALTKEEQKHD